MRRVYKILTAGEWALAQAKGRFEGSAVDLTDGYIHLSDAAQVQETARLHFRGRADLVLVTLDAEALGQALKWERSRAGALFPHLYAALDPALAREARPLALGADGVPVIVL
jgi:uncharacterized protein (DUF952 family)